MNSSDPTAAVRRAAYLFLGTIAVAVMVAKIVGAENVYEPSRYAPPAADSFGAGRIDAPSRKWPAERPDPTPAFGSNDRSRWATVESLVHGGTYVVGTRKDFAGTAKPFGDRGIIFDPKTERILTLDVVMNPATGEFFSSKPPLFATLLAGEYWLLHELTGVDIRTDRWPVMCVILLTVNVLPFVLYLLLLAKLAERHGRTDFGKLLTFAVAALGTFLLTFSNTLNNHTPAAYCALFAVYPFLASRDRGATYLIAGLCAGMAVCLDLPSAALAAALLWVRPKFGLLFAVAAVVPVIGQFACNYAALGTFTPAYAEFGGPWYNYAGSHWAKWDLVKAGRHVPGLDFNREPTHIYAFHVLFGHHGWFSLTPAFLLGLAAMIGGVRRGVRDAADFVLAGPPLPWGRGVRGEGDSCESSPVSDPPVPGPDSPSPLPLSPRGEGFQPSPSLPGEGDQQSLFSLPLFTLMTAVVSAVVVGFYLTRTQSYNYGGNTSGPRWLFWLIPLWLVCGLSAADWLGRRRWGGLVAALLLGVSALSAFYPAWNPWRSPWVMQAGERLHWWNYEAPKR